MQRRSFLRAGCALCVAGYASGIHAAKDWLDLPARMSARASTRLLLALSRDGEGAKARLVAAGQRGIILVSSDQGTSWQQSPVPVYVTLTALTAFGDRAYAVGYDGVVLRSDDAGRTWRKLLDGRDGNALTLAAAERRFGASRKDDDARIALEDVKATLEFGPANPLFGVAAQSAGGRDTVIAVGAFGQAFRSRDGGAWESLLDRIDNPDNLHYNAITLTRDGAFVIVSEAGRVHVSVDAGQSWRRSETGYNGALFGVIDAPRGQEGFWVHGFAGTIFATADRGVTWRELPRLGRLPLVASARNAAGEVAIVALNGTTHVADATRWRTLKKRPAGLAAAIVARDGGWVVAGSKGVAQVPGDA